MGVGRTTHVHLHGRRRDRGDAREAQREHGDNIVRAAAAVDTAQGRRARAGFAGLTLDKHLQDLDKDHVKPAIEDFGEAFDRALRKHKDGAHVGHAECRADVRHGTPQLRDAPDAVQERPRGIDEVLEHRLEINVH